MKHTKRPTKKGLTLTELLIAMTIFTLFAAIFANVMFNSAVAVQMLTEKVVFIDERQKAATAADLDLSHGVELSMAKDKEFTTTTNDKIIDYSLVKDGDDYTLVRETYASDNPTVLVSKMVVVDKIVSDDPGFPIFQYFDSSDQQLAPPTGGLDAIALNDVQTIHVALDRSYSRYRKATSGYDHLILSIYNPIDTE